MLSSRDAKHYIWLLLEVCTEKLLSGHWPTQAHFLRLPSPRLDPGIFEFAVDFSTMQFLWPLGCCAPSEWPLHGFVDLYFLLLIARAYNVKEKSSWHLKKKVMHYPISFRPHSSSNPPSWIRPSPTPSTSSFATSLELSTLRLSPTNRRQSQNLWRHRNFVQTCVWWRSECFEAFDQNLNGPRVERSCHLLANVSPYFLSSKISRLTFGIYDHVCFLKCDFLWYSSQHFTLSNKVLPWVVPELDALKHRWQKTFSNSSRKFGQDGRLQSTDGLDRRVLLPEEPLRAVQQRRRRRWQGNEVFLKALHTQ